MSKTSIEQKDHEKLRDKHNRTFSDFNSTIKIKKTVRQVFKSKEIPNHDHETKR